MGVTTSERWSSIPGWVTWSLGFLFLVALALGRSFAEGVNLQDEAWFLRLIDRFLSGETPYVDFRMGLLPLSLQLAALPATVLGAQLAVVKGVVAAAWAGSVVLGVWVARESGIGLAGRATLTLAMVALGLPAISGAYNPLSVTGVMAAMAAAIWFIRREKSGASPWAPAVVLGAAAGATFAVKFTVGAAVALGVAIVIWWGLTRGLDAGTALRCSLLAAAAFLVVVAASTIPVIAAGAFSDMTYELFDKSAFLRGGSTTYWEGLSSLTSFRARGWGAVNSLPFLLPPATVIAGVVAWVRTSAFVRWQLIATGVFALAGLTIVYPRADLAHVSYAAPALIVALGVFAHHALAGLGSDELLSRVIWGAGTALVVVALVAGLGPRILSGLERPLVADGPFRGGRVPEGTWQEITTTAEGLADAAGPDGTVLILSPRASTLYLVSGVDNPTEFDYPAITQFGATGMDEVAAAVGSGEIEVACVADAWPPGLAPDQLIASVRDRLEPRLGLPLCEILSATG